MEKVFQSLLLVGLACSVLSFILQCLHRRKVTWAFYSISVLSQLAYLLVIILSSKFPEGNFEIYVLYNFVWNLLVIAFSIKKRIFLPPILLLNLGLASLSYIFFRPDFILYENNFFFNYLFLSLVFSAWTFAIIAFQLYLILFDIQFLLKHIKTLSILSGILWLLGMISRGLWGDYAWGRFWSGDPYETQSLFTFLILLVTIMLSFPGEAKRIKKLYLLVLYILILILLTIPIFSYFMWRGHGGYV